MSLIPSTVSEIAACPEDVRAGAERSAFLLRPMPGPFGRVQHAIADWRRDRKNKRLAAAYPKAPIGPYPDHGFSLLVEPHKNNGLCRAYRYEIERLKDEGLYNPASRNLLVLGQPRQYRKLLKTIPAGFAEAYRIGLWVTEFDVMPPDWGFACHLVHEIWTPSEFSARALAASGLPVSIVPHAVKVAPVPPLPRARFGVPENAFLGLAIMDLGTCPDRKNPLAHIAAWRMAFADDANAHLLMKVRFGRRTGFARTALVKALQGVTNITLVEDEFSDEEMAGFQRMGDVYLSLHRAEGYGLNIHEMLAHDIPVVATAYSGNMTFMPRFPQAHDVPYRLIPYQDPTMRYRGSGLVWAEANIAIASKLLRDLSSMSAAPLHLTGAAA